MSRRETHMTLWYWQQVGGTLIEEFMLVPRAEAGRRLVDAVINLGRTTTTPADRRKSIAGEKGHRRRTDEEQSTGHVPDGSNGFLGGAGAATP
jgi:hypothetical protein